MAHQLMMMDVGKYKSKGNKLGGGRRKIKMGKQRGEEKEGQGVEGVLGSWKEKDCQQVSRTQ